MANKTNYPTLTEAFLSHVPSVIDALEKRIGDTVDNMATADDFFKQYQRFLALVDDLAGTDLEAGHTPEEVSYRQDQSVDGFFKWLLSRAKNELLSGKIDWDHFPSEKTVAKMVLQAIKKNAPKPLSDIKPEPMSPEDHAERMHRGDYGKLD